MAAKLFSFAIILVLTSQVHSASIFERSYEYVMNLGKSLAPGFLTMLDCIGDDDLWKCAREKAGKMLEGFNEDVEKQRQLWQVAADAEVESSGRTLEEMPSKLGLEVEQSLISVADLVKNGVARAMSRKKHSDTVDSITISTSSDKKKKEKKKKKPSKIHLVQMLKDQKQDRGFQSWVIGDRVNDTGVRRARGMFSDMWSLGEKTVNYVAEHALASDVAEDGVADKSSAEENRGKKKKKKKAILKLLILGAVLKAKIGTLLQILSFKLQVKFFLIALIGLGINLARFWLDLKKSHHQQPQKVIYYEHAQHQHHYDHEEEPSGWGPWSRSIAPPEEAEPEIDVDFSNNPYRAQVDRNTPNYVRPIVHRV